MKKIKKNNEYNDFKKDVDVLIIGAGLSGINTAYFLKDSNLKVEGCFICIGYTPSSEIFKGVIELDKDGYIKADDKNRTNVKGIYAAGDIVKKERFQLISAMNDGVVAASTCIKELK